MRKITKMSIDAFLRDENFKNSNMTVTVKGETELRLHGNLIAKKHGNKIKIFDGGWQTNTTKERLNGLLSEIGSKIRVFQKNWVWYFSQNGEVYPFTNGFTIIRGIA